MFAFSKAQLHQLREFFEQINKGQAPELWQGHTAGVLQQQLMDAIDQGLLEDVEANRLAYWALSKRFDPSLVPAYRRWLSKALEQEDEQAIFQLMIGLDNLEEPVFGTDRSGYASFEEALNRRDATRYLNQPNP